MKEGALRGWSPSRACNAAIAIAIAASLGACGGGPSIKQQADERAQRNAAVKKQEDFARSLPPTEAKPIYKP